MPVVGRTEEIGRLRGLVDEIRRRGGVRVVSGPPGIGKSTLLRVATEHAVARGLRVLTASGVQSETHLPFAALHQVLRPVLGRVDRLPHRQRSALLAAFGMADVDAPATFLIGLAALELLAEAAEETPVLVVVEDAHWLDRPSAEVLAFLARRLESEPVVLLLAVRDGYDSPLSDGALPNLRVGELDEGSSRALLDEHGGSLTEREKVRILAEAAGTPLALVELPTLFGGGTSGTPASGPSALSLSSRLEQAYAARLHELPPATRRLLLLAAANDSDLLVELLAAAADGASGGSAAALEQLEPAIRAGLVTTTRERLQFRHPLVRSAVYQATTLPARQRAHATLARALAHDRDRHAWHRAAAATRPDEGIAAEVEEMGRRARARGGGAVALAALARAADLTPDPVLRGERLLRAGELAVQTGDPARAGLLLSEADRLLVDPVPRARMRLLHHLIDPGVPGEPAAVLALVETALSMATSGQVDLALDYLMAAAMQAWWADPGDATRRRVVHAVFSLPVPGTDPRVLSVLGFTDPAGHGAFLMERAATLSPGTFDPDTAHLLGTALNLAGAFDLSRSFVDHAAIRLRDQGRLGLLPTVLTQQAWTAISMLDRRVAVPAADEAVSIARETGQPLWVAAAQIGQAMLAGLRGDATEAERLVREAETIVLPLGASAVMCGAQLTRGVSALGVGRYSEAFDQLRRLFEPGDPAYHHFQSSWGVGDLVDAAVHSGNSGNITWARGVVAKYETVAAASANPWLHVGLVFARPLLADGDAAEALFRDGLAAPLLTRWPLYRTRLLLEYGSWLRRRRRVAESRAPLRAALEACEALGGLVWADRARRELRASGEVGHAHQPEPWAQLSPQELQIAQLAAAGLSNREIGQRLYLSHRTIGSHLYRTFPKLGITSRAQLRLALEGAEDGELTGEGVAP